jgi:hypothetical protein
MGYHADPTDYWRFTLDGLRLLCRYFEELDSGIHIGPSCGLAQLPQLGQNFTNFQVLFRRNSLFVGRTLAQTPM